MGSIEEFARDEVDRRFPIWLDTEENAARQAGFRAGFVKGASWAATRTHAHTETAVEVRPREKEKMRPSARTDLNRRSRECATQEHERLVEQVAQVIDTMPLEMWDGQRIIRDPQSAAKAALRAVDKLRAAPEGLGTTLGRATVSGAEDRGWTASSEQSGPRAARTDWAEAKWAMVANEGRWVLVAENVSSALAGQLRSGKNQSFSSQELDHFVFTNRRPESPNVEYASTRTNLWGKYAQNLPVTASAPNASFRAGEPAAVPLSRTLPFLPPSSAPLRRSDEVGKKLPVSVETVHATSATYLAPSDRLPGSMRTHVVRDGFWLVGSARSRSDGAGKTPIVVKARSGETITSFTLLHRVVRVFASVHREHIFVLDSNLAVLVFDFQGHLVREFSLAENPEVLLVTAALQDGPKASAMIRGFDVSPISGDIAFSVLDNVWRFTSDGRPISAFRFRQQGSELTRDLEEQMSQPTDAVGRDWIYFLRFSDRSDSLFVSTYAGSFLSIPRFEIAETHWDVQSVTEDILETDESLLISGWGGLHSIDSEGDVDRLAEYGGKFYSATLLVGSNEAFNPMTRKSVHFEAESTVRGTYLNEGLLRVELGTGYLEAAIP